MVVVVVVFITSEKTRAGTDLWGGAEKVSVFQCECVSTFFLMDPHFFFMDTHVIKESFYRFMFTSEVTVFVYQEIELFPHRVTSESRTVYVGKK